MEETSTPPAINEDEGPEAPSRLCYQPLSLPDEHGSSHAPLPTQSPVLSISDPSSNPWDGNGASSPAVVKLPSDSGKVYRMYYYGQPGSFLGCGVDTAHIHGVPFGWIGCAESNDGIHWSRVNGDVNPPGGAGAVFGPSEVDGTFDRVAVGVGDAILRPDGSVWLYYFGYDSAQGSPGMSSDYGTSSAYGFCIGLAISTDGGMTFSRPAEPILKPGNSSEWDSTFVAWPKVLPPEQSGANWIMTYNAKSPSRDTIGGSAGVAVSKDGFKWEKVPGPALSSGAPGTFDSAGVGTRHVIKANGRFLMFYEGVCMAPGVEGYPFLHQIGVAESEDGIHWEKCVGVGKDPGGPVLSHGEPGAWDDFCIGTPHVCVNGSKLLLYYVGFGRAKGKGQIGLAFGSLEDLSKWRKV
eukprot:TRINITY_DN1801_c1_g1_i3.p1 TRINITY_DN1801_c1_g1~~TRINITY_DN1801_c1_g1_i3.p1  ORF type:complete len:408 (-),score=41.88 TRINITY_DN1801_c1_g1_i3:443-1666(-)